MFSVQISYNQVIMSYNSDVLNLQLYLQKMKTFLYEYNKKYLNNLKKKISTISYFYKYGESKE